MKKILLALIIFFPILVLAQTQPFNSKQLAPTPVNGRCLTTNGLINAWGICASGGGSAGGTWSTTTSSVAGQLINYSNNNTDIVTVGGTSTSSATFIFNPNTGTSTLSNTIQKSLNNYTIYADQMPGADVGAKLTAATNALPSSGGIVDARNLKGNGVGLHDINQANFNLGKSDGRPVTYLLGPGTTTLNSAITDINVFDNVTIIGNNTTIAARPSTGITNSGRMFSASSTSVTGSITAGSNILTVSDPSYIKVGKVVGVLGMAGGSAGQNTTISGGISNVDTAITIASATGLDTTISYFLIDNEILSATRSGTTLTATRGLLGTSAASHLSGATIYYLPNKVTRVMAVNGTSVTLQDSSILTLTNTSVGVGSQNIVLTGTLTLDGQHYRTFGAEGSNPTGFGGVYATYSTVDKDVTMRYFDFGGVICTGCWNNKFGGAYYGNGRPDDRLGFSLLVFGQSKYNLLNPSSVFDSGAWGISIDDRTTSASVNDGAGMYNVIQAGPIAASTTIAAGRGIGIGGGQFNTIYASTIYTSNDYGIYFSDDNQWPIPQPASDNKAYVGNITGSPAVFDATGHAIRNFVEAGTITGALTIPGGTGVQQGFNFLGPQVGIGTTSTSAKLTIQGDGASTGRAFLISNSASTTLFSVLDNGKTGIFVSPPTAPLELATSSGSNAKITFGNVASSIVSDFFTKLAGATVTFSRPSDGSPNASAIFQYQTSGNLSRFGIASRGDIVFASGGGSDYTTAPERFRILSTNGYLGIATTTPGTMLGVVGDGYFTGSLTASNFTATSTIVSNIFPYASTTAISAGTICLTGDTCRTTWPTGGGGGGSDHWATSTDGTTIYNTNLPGNVAIGTTTSSKTLMLSAPMARFGIQSTNTSDGNFTDFNITDASLTDRLAIGYGHTGRTDILRDRAYITGAGVSDLIFNTDVGKKILFATGGLGVLNLRMALDENGNFGIGTTSPFAKVDIVGANNGTNPLFQVSNVSSFATTSQFLIDSSGRIMIGTTTTPNGKLIVLAQDGSFRSLTLGGAGANVSIKDENGGGSANRYGWTGVNNSDLGGFGASVTDSTLNRYIIGIPGVSEYLTVIPATGRVGIGSTTPGAALGIQGNMFIAGNIVSTSTTAASAFPYASTTAISAGTICLTSDICRTTWPSGGGGGSSMWASTTPINGLLNSFIYPNSATGVSIGSTTPWYNSLFTLASSTGKLLTLTDGSAITAPWNLSIQNGSLVFATSSVATGATSTPAVQIGNGSAGISVGTSTITTIMSLGNNPSTTNGSSTIMMGKLQWDGYDSGGIRRCSFINTVGALVTITGACTP